tara:strand:+ start:186 stop:629 length:444 start_codon:yes stop_codon:yes gene_type:complete
MIKMENLNNEFMKISVIHRAYEEFDEIEKVAEVKVYRNANLEENISFANRVTQNIEGSWSRDKYMPNGDLNSDYNPWINVIKPLKVDANDKEWGHRSTSEGDVFVLDSGEAYIYARRGLHQIDLDKVLKLDSRDVYIGDKVLAEIKI